MLKIWSTQGRLSPYEQRSTVILRLVNSVVEQVNQESKKRIGLGESPEVVARWEMDMAQNIHMDVHEMHILVWAVG